MNILEKLKQSLNVFKKDQFVLNDPIYMENSASLVCADKQGKVRKTARLFAKHVDQDNQDDFPSFQINKTSSIDGEYGMYSKNVLVLDADDVPTLGSKKLITSHTLYQIIEDLQCQINELNEKIECKTK